MIKSQDELTEQGRQSEVLIKAIEKCQRLEEDLKTIKKIIQSSRKTKDGKILAIYEIVRGFR